MYGVQEGPNTPGRHVPRSQVTDDDQSLNTTCLLREEANSFQNNTFQYLEVTRTSANGREATDELLFLRFLPMATSERSRWTKERTHAATERPLSSYFWNNYTQPVSEPTNLAKPLSSPTPTQRRRSDHRTRRRWLSAGTERVSSKKTATKQPF